MCAGEVLGEWIQRAQFYRSDPTLNDHPDEWCRGMTLKYYNKAEAEINAMRAFAKTGLAHIDTMVRRYDGALREK